MENELRCIVDALPGFVWTARPDGQVDFLNQTWCEYTGRGIDQSCGVGWQAAVHPDDLPGLLAGWQSVKASEPSIGSQVRLRGKDGQYKWYLFRGRASVDASGEVVQWCGFATDIDNQIASEITKSPQGRAESVLSESEAEACRIVGSIPGIVVFFMTPDGKHEVISPQIAKYFGKTLDELDQWVTNETVHPEDRANAVQVFQRAIALGEPYRFEARFRRSDGRYRWFQCRGFPNRKAAGSIARWYCVGIDIDERKRGEDALSQSEARLVEAERELQLMIDSIPVRVATYSADGTRMSGNRLVRESMGGAPIDQWNERVHPDDVELVESKWRACVASGEPFEHSYRWRMHDGTFHWHASRRVPLRDATGKIIRWYSCGYDIEDQKRAEALLAGEKRLLEMVANDHPLSETLEALCRLVESTAAGSSCSVVLVDPSGTTLEEAIAPSLPTEFNEAVRGWPVERLGGPCQGAARDKTQIIMSDVESDTRWRTSWRALAQKHGLRSCWSTPLMSRAGKVLGTFALYQREPATPSRRQLELIEQFTSVASIAIERAQRDNALRQSEARRAEAERELQLTIDTIPAFVTVFRPDGEREYVNKTWRDNTGLQVADVQHGAWTRIVHPEDQERSEQLWRQALESGEPFEIEQRIRRHDGVYRWHLGRRAPLRDDSGNILRWYSVAIDIDDQKRAEDARRRSEAELAEAKRELELTIDTIPTLIASYWPNGERDFVSKNWQAYTGISQEEARGKSSTNTFHPDRRDTGEIVWQACLASGKPYEAIERLRRADGEYRWHWIRRVPLRDEAGKIIKWYGVGQDIEHQKQAEAALLNSEARLTEAERELRLTLDSIPTITWRAAPNGYVQQLNRQWFEYTGTTPEQVRGWRWKLCVHPDDLEQLVEIGTQYVTSGTSIDSEARLRRHDGEYRWFLFRPAAARDESGNIVAWYGTISDIEDRKRAEQKALEAEREVQRMLDSIPAMIVRGGTNGYIQYFSKQWFDYTGTTLDTQRGFRWWESLHPDDKDRVVQFGARFVASGVTGDCEARLRCFDGTYRWFLFRPAPIHDGAGNFTGWYGTVTDIEEQKRAEQALVTSERNLQLTFDTMPAIAWAANPDGSAEFFNQNYLNYVGLPLQQVVGWGWTAVVHPDDLDGLASYWKNLLEAGTSGEAEARLRRHDGRYRWFLFRTSPLQGENGKIVKWYGVNTDIEDRKQAETRIAGEKQLLELVSVGRSLPAGLAAVCKFFENAAPDCQCGIYPIDWSGPIFQSGVAPSLPPGYLDNVEGLPVEPDTAPCGTAAQRKELVVAEDIETDPRWLNSSYRSHVLHYGLRAVWSTPICSRDGLVLGTFCIYQRQAGRPSAYHQELISHVTHIASIAMERSRAEAELRRSETSLAEGQRISSTGTFSWRLDTNELTFSDELCRIFEFEPNAAITFERIFEQVHPEDMPVLSERMKLVRGGRKPEEQEVRLRMRDGRIKHLRTVGQMMHHSGARPEYLGAIQDITQRKAAEDSAEKIRSELAHVTRVMSLGALTASIAHEVNQPLAGIVTNASTCLRMLGADPPNIDGARETARRTIRDGNRAADVIKRLRALFGKKPAAAETMDLNEATREVLQLILGDLLRNRVIARVELDDEPLLVTGDRVQLQQVILNLVRNASDAMIDVNDRERHLLVAASREQDGTARLIVRDNGIGLQAQPAERLFDAFYTSKTDGMGIGLSVSRSIVESHGGRIWGEGNDGPGATFSFSIPPQRVNAGDGTETGAVWTAPTRGAHDLSRDA